MADKAKYLPKDYQRVGALLRAARDAVGASRETAAGWVGAHQRTVQNWEEASSQTALRLALYIRELAQKSDLSREFILHISGLAGGEAALIDPELNRKLALVRAAHGSESRV